MFLDIAYLLIGFVGLILGAEYLVRGSRDIASALGVPTLIIGLTIVAFGTSAPELFVSLSASMRGTADVAVGNIIGSNIFNILVIIGLSAVLRPLVVAGDVIKREMPIMLLGVGSFWLMGLDGNIGRLEGSFLFLGILLYLLLNYFIVVKGSAAVELLEDDKKEKANLVLDFFFIVLGLLGLTFGADFIVDGATSIARDLGVSDLIIGVTLVAIGTSLPELATTCVAALRHESDLTVGNAVGSNIFNVFCVIGLTAAIAPLAVDSAALAFDMPYMFLACFLVLPLMMFRRRLGRLEGSILILGYIAYLVFIVLNELSA